MRILSHLSRVGLVCLACVLGAPRASLGQISFSEVSNLAGVGGDTYDSTSRHGLGINWIDYDNDGFPDLFLPNGGGEVPHLFRNNAGNGTFTRKDGLLPALPIVEMTGSVFADYDNDGDMDIYITVGGSDLFAADGSPNFLLKNLWVENGNAESAPMFVEVAAAAGVDNRPPVAFGPNGGYKSYTATWLDYDLDSCIDLFVGTMVWDAGGSDVNRNALYKNDCDGTFTNVTTSAGLFTGDPVQDRPTLVVFGGLMDDDLYPDLYVVNVQQASPYHHDQYFHNNGDGTFTDLTSTMPGIGDDSGAGMGIDLADIDLDGDWDIYISDLANPGGIEPVAENNVLYKGNPGGTWSENSAPAAGVKSFDSWAVNFFDLNHDGYEELLVGVIAPTQMKDELYQNDGDGTFTDISVAAGMISGDSRGSAAADYDRDGDLDFAIVNLNGTLFLYKNNTAGLQNWLQIDLDATVSNRAAIGALIEVKAGGNTYTRQIKSGVSSHSQNELTAHFGLGTATTINEIKVSWPSGAVTVVTNVAVNQRMTLVEDGTIGNTPPSALFIHSTSGLTINLDASSSTDNAGIVSYNWTFGDGSTGSGVTPSHTYAAAGTYTVVLTVADAEGLMDSESKTVTVNESGGTGAFLETDGLVSMEAENAQSQVDRDDHTWLASAANAGFSGASAMLASPDDGTRVRSAPEAVSPELIFEVNFATAGTYYVWHRIWGDDSKSNKTFSGVEGVAETSPLSVGTFDVWTWTNGKLDGTDATITVSTPGIHTVHVWMAEDGAYVDKLVLTTDANFTPTGTGPAESPRDGGGPGNSAPVASFTYTATDLALSVDGSASTDADGSIVSYAWTFGDGATATGAAAGHTYAAAGTYTVSLTVTDNEGATGSSSQSVTVTGGGGGGTGAFIESAGMVIMEAENFHEYIARGTDSWVGASAYAGASSGSYMDTTPDDNTEIKTGAETTSPELSFDVDFSTTGSYFIWGRIYAPSNKSNSMHAGIDGVISTTTNGFQTNALGQWVWVALVKNGVSVPLSIGSAGAHTVHVWMREDGTAIDKLVLTTDAGFVPTGEGPAESPRASAPVASAARRGVAIDGLTLQAEALPTEFSLEGNYPNPFNPTTTIRFALPEAAVVRLSVYDMLGREVARVLDGELPAGRHEATWNGRTDAGLMVSSGTYLLRMTAGDFSATTRMVVVK